MVSVNIAGKMVAKAKDNEHTAAFCATKWRRCLSRSSGARERSEDDRCRAAKKRQRSEESEVGQKTIGSDKFPFRRETAIVKVGHGSVAAAA